MSARSIGMAVAAGAGMPRSLSSLVAVVAATAVIACAGRGARPGVDEPAVLIVDNQTLDDLTMYMVTDAGNRTRIGDALSLHKVDLQLYSSWLIGTGMVTFVGVPKALGGHSSRSEQLHVSPGDTVSIVITP